MTGVVLRCPNCGTTQGAPGECEACHEGQVRHFCTNHTPGRWLDGQTCAECGARFGDRAPPSGAHASPVGGPVAAPPRPAPRRRPERPEPELRPYDPGAPMPEGRDRRGPNPWLDLVAAAARASIARRGGPPPEREVRRGGGGCLGRMLLLLMILVALVILAPLVLGAFLGLL